MKDDTIMDEDTKQSYEARIEPYREEIHLTITKWFEAELTRLDKALHDAWSCMQATELDCTDHAGAVDCWNIAKHQKIKLKQQIDLWTNQTIIGFGSMLQRLNDSGIWLLPEDTLKEAIDHHLFNLGVKLGKIQGDYRITMAEFHT